MEEISQIVFTRQAMLSAWLKQEGAGAGNLRAVGFPLDTGSKPVVLATQPTGVFRYPGESASSCRG